MGLSLDSRGEIADHQSDMRQVFLRPLKTTLKGKKVILQCKLFSNRNPGHYCHRYLFLALLPAFILAGCDNSAKQEAVPAAPRVTVVTAEGKDTPIIIEFVGKTASSLRVEIRSRIEGFLEKRLYTEGSRVQKGDVLFEMDKKPFEAQLDAAKAELAEQQARRETAKANLDRIEPLVKQNAVAKKDLDDALGAYNTASAAVEAAGAKIVQAELNLGYCTIKSPVSGLSSYATQREGAYIGYGSGALTYVAQINPIWVEFSVSENQLLKLRSEISKGRVVEPRDGNFDVEVVLADGSIFPHTGKIAFADASLSEKTGTFLIRAEVDNPPGKNNKAIDSRADHDSQLRPGQFGRVRLKGAIRPAAILVPQAAVQQGAQGSFVWVVKDGKAEFQPVEVGPWHGDQWFIDQGLEKGDVVVVDGALKLRAGVPVQIVEPEEKKAAAKKSEGAEPAAERKD